MKKLYSPEPTMVAIDCVIGIEIATAGRVTYPRAIRSITIISTGREKPANIGAITIIPLKRTSINP